jgi:RNA polymerase sigma factor (sigma-70 family)
MENSVPFRWRKSSEISSADLLRECGQKLTDRGLWLLFQNRFQRPIFLLLLRTLKYHNKRGNVGELVSDLGQEVYVRLVQNNGNMLRNFRGDTEFSVRALFARVCTSVVADHFRHDGSRKRLRDNIVSIEEAKEVIEASKRERDEINFDAILSWIDIERVVAADPDRKHAQRNALIFKLHYMDGLTAEEIASYPGFDVNSSGVEAVLTRIRKRIRK